jgi:hypothetical protein
MPILKHSYFLQLHANARNIRCEWSCSMLCQAEALLKRETPRDPMARLLGREKSCIAKAGRSVNTFSKLF